MADTEAADDISDADCIIIGAGLSGLATAYYLQKEHDIIPLILEARPKIGGRILTEQSIDLGATWLGAEHHQLLGLLDELDVATFPQFQQGRGIFIHSAADPPHYFDTEENAASTLRINGGSGNLIKTLARRSGATIKLNQTVKQIKQAESGVKVTTASGVFIGQKVVVTLPPQLAVQRIQCIPTLPRPLTGAMQTTHTWMSNAIKVALIFDAPFWREQNLSGTLIAPTGPVIEMYDHSNPNGGFYSLMGFANEALREQKAGQRKKAIINFLAEHLGEQIHDYSGYIEKDWISDPHTATSRSKSIYMHPDYGNDVFDRTYMNGTLWFSGSETSPQFGGYMEGAVASAKRAAEFLQT